MFDCISQVWKCNKSFNLQKSFWHCVCLPLPSTYIWGDCKPFISRKISNACEIIFCLASKVFARLNSNLILKLQNMNRQKKMKKESIVIKEKFIAGFSFLCPNQNLFWRFKNKLNKYQFLMIVILNFQEIPDTLKIIGAVIITGAILSSGIKTLLDSSKPWAVSIFL